MTDDNLKPDITTLNVFIRAHSHLLAAMGVFGALTALSSQLHITLIGQLLSFFCFAITILLGLELYKQIPTRISLKLDFFKIALYLILVIISVYWLTEYRTFWKIGLSGLITMLLAVLLGKERKRLYRQLGWDSSNWGPGQIRLESIIINTVTLLIFITGLSLSGPVNVILDTLRTILTAGPR